MLKISHPHIHSLLGISMGHVLQLVSELRLGDLKKYLADNISNKQIFPTNRRLYLYCAQIAEVRGCLYTRYAAQKPILSNFFEFFKFSPK